VSNLTKPNESIPRNHEELVRFVKRAESGDTSTLPALRDMLQDQAAVDLFGGNLARQVELSLVEKAAGKNLAFREALLRKLDLMRAELAGPSPTPLEKLLVGRIVTCWLQLHDLDARIAQSKDWTIAQADYHERCRDRAHRRHLSAIKMLATVRRLALPILVGQVNIAKNQVNTANLAAAEGSP
jgi:hypothetical protein